MSKIKVMTDSSVQLTKEEIEKYDITVVPLTITIDGKSYVDGVDITRSDFVKKMNVKDSASLRKYMTKNEPGIDYNITVERPESLGGGSMSVFLQFDEFIFLDIPE